MSFILEKLNNLSYELLEKAMNAAYVKSPAFEVLKDTEIDGGLSPFDCLFQLMRQTLGVRYRFNMAILKELVSDGLDPMLVEGQQDEDTSLYEAAYLFLAFKVQGNRYVSKFGGRNTCLHDALICRGYTLPLVMLLIQHGADPDVCNIDQDKPLHVAIEAPFHIDVITYLFACSLSRTVSPGGSLSALDVVNALLELDLSGLHRRLICAGLFRLDLLQSYSFTEIELFVVLADQTKVIERQDIQLLDKIGSGTYGSVYKALKQGDAGQTFIAVKLNKSQGDKTLREEAAIHRQFNHANIVPFDCVLEKNDRFGIAMKFAASGSLHMMVFSCTKKEIDAIFFDCTLQMMEGLRYLHELGYVHADLTANNVLIDNGRVYLADFSATAKQGETRTYDVTTYFYSSPERFDPDEPYAFSNDIFSAGVIFGLMDAQKMPWSEAQDVSRDYIEDKVCRGDRTTFGNQVLQPKVAGLVQWCWEQNPDRRPSAKEVQLHLIDHFSV